MNIAKTLRRLVLLFLTLLIPAAGCMRTKYGVPAEINGRFEAGLNPASVPLNAANVNRETCLK